MFHGKWSEEEADVYLQEEEALSMDNSRKVRQRSMEKDKWRMGGVYEEGV